jgi:cation transport ATPase
VESLPVRLAHGADAMSGSTNAGEAFDLTATREARDSTYAGIVRSFGPLVSQTSGTEGCARQGPPPSMPGKPKS